VIEAVEAIRDGRSKALVCLGGNLAVAMSDPEVTFKAMRSLDLAVHIATKLNRTHLLLAKQSFILPCLGRTEVDVQAAGRQSVTVEDSMSMVHASRGGLKPASEHLRSEPAIIAGIAQATLPNTRVGWADLVSDYGKIRDCIEAVFPEFADFNARIKKPGGFRLYVAASEREWLTPTKKANFLVHPGLDEDPRAENREALTLTTIRSHDQYNTTIYGMNDRYRGITGRRDVVFVNESDLASRGLKHGDLVDVSVVPDAGSAPGERVMRNLTAVAYNIAQGSIAAYYPEANVLVALDHYDAKSGTPSYKSTPVLLRASPNHEVLLRLVQAGNEYAGAK
jgi:molybdopterin-dependent oxidoreductase alpha subunit